MKDFLSSSTGIVTAGGIIGAIAAYLVYLGNPPNMGVCVACFTRDTAGAIGLHRAGAVQYIRPELVGFVFGSLLSALAFREFRPRGGSAPLIRFVLGFFAMVGALAFLGCPWRALARLAGGDLNAVVGIAGLAAGITVGVWFLKTGYSLGRSAPNRTAVGLVMPAFMLFLFLLVALEVKFTSDGPVFFSSAGPGSMHAPLFLSLGAGLLVGVLAQRTRFCTMGALRDVILIKDFHLLSGVIAFVVAAFAVNFLIGKVNIGFAQQPIAHSNHLWNFLGMCLSGLCFALAGGCPGRQFFMSGEGDADATVFIFGMLMGAAFAHNLDFAAAPDKFDRAAQLLVIGGPSAWGQSAVLIGLVITLAIGFSMRERIR
ncbi:MAG: YedE-related selenium metabolism membrane protein [Syntrophobacterales bacterium]|nr:YedE-related selenium metabolism membrane protein [Syntrophobacterales bacterium]HRT27239.1 YedE family putative selenium transporter [Syntrophales bacterium]